MYYLTLLSNYYYLILLKIIIIIIKLINILNEGCFLNNMFQPSELTYNILLFGAPGW